MHFQKYFFFFKFLTVLGLLLCEGFSLVVQSRGCSLVAICGLLVMVASLVVEHEAVGTGLSSSGLRALEHRLSGCDTRA